VFLVPGLLGFENFASFRYFADRVVAALRAGLEQRWQQPVPVIAVPIPPTASLHERQRKLVKTLADRLDVIEPGQPPLQVHLVGHSTGGLDANLLTYPQPVAEAAWADLDPRAPKLRDRIRSVISIASPLQGACITRDPVARLLSQGDPRGAPGLTSLVLRFCASAAKDFELADGLNGASREAAKTLRFLREVISKWQLLADLQPSMMLDSRLLKQDVRRRSFVTVTGRAKRGEHVSPADGFFRELAHRASGRSTGCMDEGELVHASVARLNRALADDSADSLLIRAPGIELPRSLDAGHNDGVVNAARQLLDPEQPDELAGIVVADHFDVVGYYDREVWQVDDEGREQQKQKLSGLLHSGSGFRDDQFFELYQRVADVLTEPAR